MQFMACPSLLLSTNGGLHNCEAQFEKAFMKYEDRFKLRRKRFDLRNWEYYKFFKMFLFNLKLQIFRKFCLFTSFLSLLSFFHAFILIIFDSSHIFSLKRQAIAFHGPLSFTWFSVSRTNVELKAYKRRSVERKLI